MKKILVSVTNDLVTDNRMNRICNSLVKMGFDVLLIGRKRKNSLPVGKENYKIFRMRLLFGKGAFFYAEYNFRLFFLLLFKKSGILLSNDLDTLPANYIVSKLKRKPLVYDSHEFYTEVPELINRPLIRRFWLTVEKFILPKLEYAYTVSNSIAEEYGKRYGIPFGVIRNFPVSRMNDIKKPNNPDKKDRIILYQGALNEARGLEFAIRAMKYIENARFVIAGDGDISGKLKELVKTENLENKIIFKGRLSPDALREITDTADLGLSVEENKGLNYRYALPNKLFDYIHANLPVLVSNLPEMAGIVNKWQIGLITPSLEPAILAGKIKEALFNDELRKIWLANLKNAAAEFCWEKEEQRLKEVFQDFL